MADYERYSRRDLIDALERAGRQRDRAEAALASMTGNRDHWRAHHESARKSLEAQRDEARGMAELWRGSFDCDKHDGPFPWEVE